MKAKWNKLITIDEAYKNATEGPGIYVISQRTNINRIIGNDPKGILYVGKSIKLKQRLNQFIKYYHPASGILWEHKKIAMMIFDDDCKKEADLNDKLGILSVRIAETSSSDKEVLDRHERAVLFAYLLKHGETPPLNSSIPGKWNTPPIESDQEWGRKGLK